MGGYPERREEWRERLAGKRGENGCLEVEKCFLSNLGTCIYSLRQKFMLTKMVRRIDDYIMCLAHTSH